MIENIPKFLKRKTPEIMARCMAESHTDLNMFSAIISMLEGGSIYTRSGTVAADKIIALCKAETLKQVRLIDRAIDDITHCGKWHV